jgi:hypothetical protein
MNCMQLLHCLSPFGLSWYFIAALLTFCCADARLTGSAPAVTTVPASRAARFSTLRRDILG